MQFNLKDKKIFITGATGGIGRVLCNKFKENGSILICTSSSKDKLNNLKNEIGSDHYFYELNLLETEQIATKVKSIVLEHSDIDVLINNAGLTKDNLFLRMKADQWNDVINVNLNSNFYIIKEILPSMLKKRKGSIIGISSLVAITGNPGQMNYTASKSAMISMYKSLALEVAQRNIRVNVIAPGFIHTPMTDKLNKDQTDSILKKIPMNRLGTPDDVANMAVFLSDDQTSYITGQTFHINGGLLMV